MTRFMTLLPLLVLLGTTTVSAAWEADANDKLQVKAADAVANFQAEVPRTARFFEEAYGYAIFPSVTRVGFGFGGAFGNGIVVERDQPVGKTRFWQFTSGIQAGAKNFSMIVFFKDQAALNDYQSGQVQFMGQAGLAVANLGVAGTPAYNQGVAIVTFTRFGLMGEFTISGGKFTYRPLDPQP